VLNLACGGLYTGGGANTVPLPFTVPDMGRTFTAITACNAGSGAITLGAVADPGGTSITGVSHRTCSSPGCFFGPPLPAPNSSSTPTSVCIINSVATAASGTTNCLTGVTSLSLPLTSQLFLTGDKEAAPGIQACPTCAGGTCQSGPNATLACTPADTNLGVSGPTSHDCPPDPMDSIGSLPIAFNLTTGTMSKTVITTGVAQAGVFCGFCYDVDVSGTQGTGGYGKCAGGANAGQVCKNSAACPSSTCGSPIPCTADTQCEPAAGIESREACRQGNSGGSSPEGAFSKANGNTINETGSVAGNMSDGLAHPSTLVSIFCVPPTFNSTVDAAADLPGPGAVSLSGSAQVVP